MNRKEAPGALLHMPHSKRFLHHGNREDFILAKNCSANPNQFLSGFLMNLPSQRRTQTHPAIYFRIKNEEEIYKWVMVQYADHLFDEKGKIIFGFTLVTDISFIKKDGPSMMSILDTNDQTCQQFYWFDGKSLEQTGRFIPKITVREMEVIKFLAIGYSSKQIAAEMKIAINTVDNHRQRMLKKTQSKSTGELVNFAIKAGFV